MRSYKNQPRQIFDDGEIQKLAVVSGNLYQSYDAKVKMKNSK